MAIKTYVTPGEHLYMIMPHSEVMMHMRIAGKRMNCEVRADSVQLLDENDRCYSFPVTLGEAGFFQDAEGIYYYKEEPGEDKCIHGTKVDDEVCKECAKVVGGRYQVRDQNGDALAVFDSRSIAHYWFHNWFTEYNIGAGIYDREEDEWDYRPTAYVYGADVHPTD